MRYAEIRELDITNGDGVGVSLFVQGCHFHCNNCFNQSAWDFTGGCEFNKDTITTLTRLLNRPFITRFSILGGEPLADENINEIVNLVNFVYHKMPSISIWVYTGYTIDELKLNKKIELLGAVNVIVDGRYDDNLKDMSLKFRGSSNQHIINLR